MKKFLKYFFLIVITNVTRFISFAQDKGVDVDINVNKDKDWYQQPWVWIVGGAIFILLLVAILRGGGSRKEV